MRVAFVTGNKGKFAEARERLASAGIELAQLDLKPVEIQADSLEEIARAKAEWVAARHEGPFLVDDGGLFVAALHDFPGVYSAFALKTIGPRGILKLMEGVEDRRARFQAVVGYRDATGALSFFKGVCEGRLLREMRDAGHGFGFDPIFVPDGRAETFAELPIAVKNELSHRGRALDALVASLKRGTARP